LDSKAQPPSLAAGRAPLFLLSFRHRDELIESVERAGWQAIAARRAELIERRFIGSGAGIAIVDARGAFDEGLAAARLLGDPVEANAGALLVLASRNDIARLDEVYQAGATHFLASPFGEREFAQALRFAGRHVARLGGGEQAAKVRAAMRAEDESWWRWRPGDTHVELSPSLVRRLPTGSGSVRGLLHLLDADGRHVALQSVRRLRETGRATAFAHQSPLQERGRIAQHIYQESDGAIVGRVEELESAGRQRSFEGRDALTGLSDRQNAVRWLGQAMERCSDGDDQCILLLISISRFDGINAAFGRATGDTLLRTTARRIERLVTGFGSRRHLVARLAGGEFAVGVVGLHGPGEAHLLGRQLYEAVSRPLIAEKEVVAFSCHIGGTTIESGERDPALLLRRASVALADAKAEEMAEPYLLDADGHAASEIANRLEIDLRSALENDEIEVLFQPQLSITTGAVIGVEALARWQHPVLGELGAVPLFAAAERSDFLVPLSRHIQRKALAIAAAERKTFRWLRLAINVTAADIAQPGFEAEFLAMVDASGFDRKRVTVEITEGGLIEDLASAATLLSAFRSGGLQVAIDDFGTGYSSLAYLKALPLDYLKIDSQLSQDITGSARGRVVVTSVIEMARSLGLSVVAEGVESEEQLALLAEAGCNVYQGFIFSPPISVTELSKLMRGEKVAG
jgi:diguanylate cyclase (GGDEF)-like protein